MQNLSQKVFTGSILRCLGTYLLLAALLAYVPERALFPTLNYGLVSGAVLACFVLSYSLRKALIHVDPLHPRFLGTLGTLAGVALFLQLYPLYGGKKGPSAAAFKRRR